jgi:hypothetical protein
VSKKAGRADGKQLLLAKNTLEHFIKAENSIVEIDTFEKKKSRYGTGWLWAGMFFDSRIRNNALTTEWHIGVR